MATGWSLEETSQTRRVQAQEYGPDVRHRDMQKTLKTASVSESVETSERLLFAVAIACSAFLVFLVQPMVAKRLLPWYGGAPGVWTLCLAFYQTTLFAGYAYAHGLMRLGRPRLELCVHAALFVAAWLALPVLPGDAWRPASGADASSGILLALIANVALPFLFLSATGPLLQAWFSRANPTRGPYFLYALSNTGSLLALFAYPFVFEPNLGLAESGSNWSVGFAGVGFAVLGCGLVAVLRGGRLLGPDSASHEGIGSEVSAADVGLWMALSGVAVVHRESDQGSILSLRFVEHGLVIGALRLSLRVRAQSWSRGVRFELVRGLRRSWIRGARLRFSRCAARRKTVGARFRQP